jgi:hypothetical protein
LAKATSIAPGPKTIGTLFKFGVGKSAKSETTPAWLDRNIHKHALAFNHTPISTTQLRFVSVPARKGLQPQELQLKMRWPPHL